jgi:hypothetical protein
VKYLNTLPLSQEDLAAVERIDDDPRNRLIASIVEIDIVARMRRHAAPVRG